MARTMGSHSQLTAPRIRDAALKLFADQGYAAVSMRQIAAAVGLQVGALYNYTPDKQSLLFDLMRSHMDELLEARAQVQSPSAPRAALEEFTRFHIRHHAQRPEAVFIAYMELRNLSPENFTIIESLRRDYEAELQAILTRGIDAGVFAVSDPRIASMAIIAMLTGVNTWYRAAGRLSLDDVEGIYSDMVVKSVSAA